MAVTETDWRSGQSVVMTEADAAKATALAAAATAAKAMDAALAGRVNLGVKTLTFASLVAVAIGPRRYSVSVPSALVGDRIRAYRDGAWPVGYELLESTYVPAADTIELSILCPALTVAAGTVNLPLAFYAIRPTA